MSGHSKWHNIQKTKGAQDAKRAAAFTKISKEMIVAVKEGGGSADPTYNSRLATVIAKAKAANMPNDNIKRVLEKAASAGQGDSYESITYEGHGPSGIAMIIETMTDNRNRTASSVRHHFDKFGGSLGVTGCVSWAFDTEGRYRHRQRRGRAGRGCRDGGRAGGRRRGHEHRGSTCFEVTTDPDDFPAVLEALERQGLQVPLRAGGDGPPELSASWTSAEDIANMEKMLDVFEDDDDVQNVWHNWDNED